MSDDEVEPMEAEELDEDEAEFYLTHDLYLAHVYRVSLKLTATKPNAQAPDAMSVKEYINAATAGKAFNVEVAKPELKFTFTRAVEPPETKAVLHFKHDADAIAFVKKVDGRRVFLRGVEFKAEAEENRPAEYAAIQREWERVFYGGGMKGAKRRFEDLSPGERPDTIVLSGLPSRWFVDDAPQPAPSEAGPAEPAPAAPPPASSSSTAPATGRTSRLRGPSLRVLRTVFSKFGRIRNVEISEVPRTGKESVEEEFERAMNFLVHVQFFEYADFCRAVRTFASRALHKEGASFICYFKLDFDRTKRFLDSSAVSPAAGGAGPPKIQRTHSGGGERAPPTPSGPPRKMADSSDDEAFSQRSRTTGPGSTLGDSEAGDEAAETSSQGSLRKRVRFDLERTVVYS
eukprot:tig00000857_g4941.t1